MEGEGSVRTAQDGEAHRGWRGEREMDPGERAVSLLATAVQRHGLYPHTSSLCAEAVAECHAAIAALPTQSIEIAVAPDAISVDGAVVGRMPTIADLKERLFRADVERVALEPGLDPGELARFCDLVAAHGRSARAGTFQDALIDLGITNIRVRLVERVRVLGTGTFGADRLAALREERAARAADEAALGTKERLAWTRVDTDCADEGLGLTDLAWLVEDPVELARVLEEATEGEPGDEANGRALVERIGDLILLFGRLSPAASEARFRSLADALLELPREELMELAREKLFPEALETGRSARLLGCFPDEVLAEALASLSGLDVGGDGVVRAALRRLDLPEGRRAALAERLGLDAAPAGPATPGGEPAARRIDVGRSGPKARALSEYRELDVSLTDEARAELDRIGALEVGEDPGARLRCIASLLFLGRNPHRIEELLAVAEPLLRETLAADRTVAAARIDEWRDVAEAVCEARPDVAAVIEALLSRLLTPDFLREHAAELEDDESLRALIPAFGHTAASAFLEAMEGESDRGNRRALLEAMCAEADALAEGLIPYLGDERWRVQRNAALVLGYAGPGREVLLQPLVSHPDVRVARQAFLSLARIGSGEAAGVVLRALRDEDDERAGLAAESIRRFPREVGRDCAREALSAPAFYLRRPGLARTLLLRVVSRDSRRADVLRELAALRFHFWRPAVMSLGWVAHRLSRGEEGR